MSVFYQCDGKAKCCKKEGCYYNRYSRFKFCRTTSDIKHAKNFEEKPNGNYVEKKPDIDWDLIDDGR